MLPKGNFVWILLLFMIEAYGHPTVQCPKSCNCTQFVKACSNFDDFSINNEKVLHIKLVDPRHDLILDKNVFQDKGLASIQSITIDNASIIKLDKDAFNNLESLTTVTIINSRIPNLDPNTFASNINLEKVKLVNNNIKAFEFLKSESLEELDISLNALTEITPNSFINLPELTFLNMSENRINKIDPLAFSNSLNLEELILANNEISELPFTLFENNAEIVTLDFTGNPLGIFNVNITSDLDKLVLKSCGLEHFENDVVKKLDMLSNLDLSNNKITKFSNQVFKNMSQLEYLDLSNNELKSLSDDLFLNNNELQKLVLDYNNFKTLPVFRSLKLTFNIYFFSCKYCNLQTLADDTFVNMPAIISMYLSHNELQKVSPAFLQYSRNLNELDLSYNNLNIIDDNTFASLTALEKLNLENNPLITVDANLFKNNGVLKNLNLASCQLTSLWKQPTSIKIPSLRQLNLSDNKLTVITPSDLSITSNLQILDVKNNPLTCSASLQSLIIWLTEHNIISSETSLMFTTHQQMQRGSNNAEKIESLNDHHDAWKKLAQERCKEDDITNFEEIIVPKVNVNKTERPAIIEFLEKINNNETVFDDDDDEYYYDEDEEDEDNDDDDMPKKIETISDIDVPYNVDMSQYGDDTKTAYTFLWPTIIFIFTALSVLIIAANAMLFVIKARRTTNYPTNVSIPHLKLHWNTGNKLKKHSGSVYQLLSEEKNNSRISLARCDQLSNQPPAVHYPKV